MKLLKHIYLLIILATSVLPSCTSDSGQQKAYNKEMLIGRWEIIAAERNGNPTETLDSTYFVFSQDGRLSSNFNLEGTEESGAFEFADNMIREKRTNGLSYQVDTLGENTLILLTQFMNFDFRLLLEKK